MNEKNKTVELHDVPWLPVPKIDDLWTSGLIEAEAADHSAVELNP